MSRILVGAKRRRRIVSLSVLASLSNVGAATADPASPTSTAGNAVAATPAPPDSDTPITVYLKPSDPAGLDAFVTAVQTPGDPAFHHFLDHDAFVRRFAPSPDVVAAVVGILRAGGLRVEFVFDNRLAVRARGPVTAINAIFGLDIHDATTGLRRGFFSTRQPTFPASLAGLLDGVGGFETLVPTVAGPDQTPQSNATGVTATFSTSDFPASFRAATGVTDKPSRLTPADYEAIYDVTPLVRAGATGAGETLAIVSTTNFTRTIPERFWKDVGVIRTGSFTVAHVDDSASQPIPADQTEADLDLEQAGAVAPGAALIDYVAPNTAGGVIDGYEAVASQDTADVVSSSVGFPESQFGINDTELLNTTLLPALNDVFLEFAAQGQTVFVSAGDGGAFQANRDVAGHYMVFPVVGRRAAYTPVLSVNVIAASPLVTAAGGTTLPLSGTDTTVSPAISVTIPTERAWGEDYLPLSALGENGNLTQAEILLEATLPKGGGGGISTVWPVPAYQRGLAGIARTLPGQVLIQLGTPATVLYQPPAGFAGRNLPDLSADADAHTGYLIRTPAGLAPSQGGTSFVAPQFAGTLALIDQALGHRVGQLNPLLYALQRAGAAPARPITSGDNWGFRAHAGYNQATGLGAMDGERLLEGLRSFDPSGRG